MRVLLNYKFVNVILKKKKKQNTLCGKNGWMDELRWMKMEKLLSKWPFCSIENKMRI